MNHRRSRIWLLGILALALAALACDPYPITGITCLQHQEDGTILAQEERSWFISADGGLTWKDNGPKEDDMMVGCARYYSTPQVWTMPDPADSGVLYRFNPEISIERSEDAGVSWRREIDLSGTEARNVYYRAIRRDGFDFRSGPFDAVIDPATKNLIVAMGYEGVLVRAPQASWYWVSVGAYSRADMRDLSITLPLIAEEILLAFLFGLLTFCGLPILAAPKSLRWAGGAILAMLLYIVAVVGLTFLFGMMIYVTRDWETQKLINEFVAPLMVPFLPGAIFVGTPLVAWLVAKRSHQERTLAFVWVSIGWLCLLLNTLRMAASRLNEFASIIPTLVLTVAVVVISWFVMNRTRFDREYLKFSLIAGLAEMVIVAACYFLWAIGGIPHYTTATLWAAGLTVVCFAASVVSIRHQASLFARKISPLLDPPPL